MKLPKIFDAVELRVLGALMEKEQATPEYYPLTLNALVAACNQKSNRLPVMDLSLSDVRSALDRLLEDVLVWQVEGTRADRWRHNLDRRWELEAPAKAILTLLLLRGPQTPGELRGRSERLHPFASPGDVESALEELAEGDEPLVVRLGRRPGQKEDRWQHLAAGPPSEEELAPPAPSPRSSSGLSERIQELEDRVDRLEADLNRVLSLLE